MKIRVCIVGTVVMGFLLGCSERGPAVSSSENKALATVNGQVITVADVTKKWSELPKSIKREYKGEDGKKTFLNELITRELLLQEARRRKLDRDPTFIREVEAFRKQMLLEAILKQEVDSRITVPDEELLSYFETHKTTLPPIEEVQAQHILVKTKDQASGLLAKLAQGANFGRLAQTYSQDPATKDKGGDLGVIRKGETLPEFEAAVFRLKPGQTSDVVKTRSGYHIIRVQSRRTVSPDTLDDVREEVRREVIKEKQQRYFDELVSGLRAKASIKVVESLPADLPMPADDLPLPAQKKSQPGLSQH